MKSGAFIALKNIYLQFKNLNVVNRLVPRLNILKYYSYNIVQEPVYVVNSCF